MEIKNFLAEEYLGPVRVLITGTTGEIKGTENIEKLNGVESEIDLTGYVLNEHSTKNRGTSPIRFMYNQPDGKLYTTNQFIFGKPLPEEELKQLAAKIKEQWNGEVGQTFQESPCLVLEGEDVFISPSHEKQSINVAMFPIELPPNHYWLGQLFKTPELQIMYEEFMQDSLIFDKLKKLCVKKKLKVTDEMNTSSMLPIHKKDKITGEIIISNIVFNLFREFQLAKNYLTFGEGTAEHDLGKIMMLAPEFSQYMLERGDRLLQEKLMKMKINYIKQI